MGVDPATIGKTVYSMPEQFLSGMLGYDQGSYIDTGVRLLESAGTRFTLLARIMPGEMQVDNVFFSCFSEEEGAYRGFMLRKDRNGELGVWLGASGCTLTIPEDEIQTRLVFVKAGSEYRVFHNGVMENTLNTPCDDYDGTLLIGCAADAQGNPFRFAQVKVDELSIQDQAMTEAEALSESRLDADRRRFE